MNTFVTFSASYVDDYGIDRLINTGKRTTCCEHSAMETLEDRYTEANPNVGKIYIDIDYSEAPCICGKCKIAETMKLAKKKSLSLTTLPRVYSADEISLEDIPF